MLKVGDTIKFESPHLMVDKMVELAKKDIETEFIYEKDGKKGYWLEVKKVKGNVLDNYECEGQLNITDFPEYMP